MAVRKSPVKSSGICEAKVEDLFYYSLGRSTALSSAFADKAAANVWAYAEAHPDEIETGIKENEAA